MKGKDHHNEWKTEVELSIVVPDIMFVIHVLSKDKSSSTIRVYECKLFATKLEYLVS